MDDGSVSDGRPAPLVPAGHRSFERWYAAVAPRVRRALVVAAGDESLGAEATDEAFVRAYARWSRVSKMSNPEGWVYRVAVNHLRRRSRLREVALEPRSLPPVDSGAVGAETRLDVMRALRALPPRERQVFALRCIADLSEAATAAALGLAPGSVSRSLHDARGRLRAELAGTTSGPCGVTTSHHPSEETPR